MTEIAEIEPLAPTIPFVKVPYKRPTGQVGNAYILAAGVVAIGSIDASECQVLMTGGSSWLAVQLSAEKFLNAIGGGAVAMQPLPAEGAA